GRRRDIAAKSICLRIGRNHCPIHRHQADRSVDRSAHMIRPALVWTALSILLLGFVYPGIVTGIAQLAFAQKAGGSLVEKDGQIVGSSLIGQAWQSDKYFHGRPSAARYDATASGGSHLGPTSKALA